MKSHFLLLFAALNCGNAIAKVWRVNNNPGITADFATVQAAHDAATTGDTIHLEPSLTNYGGLSISKKITVLSTGNYLTANPGQQYSSTPAYIFNITAGAAAAGSVISCNISNVSTLTAATNIRFERCEIYVLNMTNCSNLTISQCYFTGNLSLTGTTNTVITNNIIQLGITVNNTSSATIFNNIFNAYTSAASSIANCTFQNNIINKGPGGISFTNCVVENNVASTNTLPAGSGNKNSVDMATVFVNPSGTNDAAFALQTNVANPAAGAGVGGTDCGAYGGITGWKPGLQPAIPALYKLTAPGAPTGNTMNVTFSIKSNN